MIRARKPRSSSNGDGDHQPNGRKPSLPVFADRAENSPQRKRLFNKRKRHHPLLQSSFTICRYKYFGYVFVLFLCSTVLFLPLFYWGVVKMQQQQKQQKQQQQYDARVFKAKKGSVSPLSTGFSIVFNMRHEFSNRQVAGGGVVVQPRHMKTHVSEHGQDKDYGGLNIRIIEYGDNFQSTSQVVYYDSGITKSYGRVIYHDPDLERGYNDLMSGPNDDDYVESYYAFDDDFRRNPFRHDDEPDKKECRRTSWHRDLLINCNTLHEFAILDRFESGDTKYLTEGGYREVYLSEMEQETVIFKAYYWGSEFSQEDFEYMRIDALVSERLTSRPEIVDIYGYCGTGMINEAMMNGDLYDLAAPYGHYGRKATKKEKAEDLLVVSNNFTGTQKLQYALEMAEALSLLHYFPDGVIVHQDVKPAQYLVTDDGHLKLNDFNRAEFLLWDEKHGEYCPFFGGGVQGVWRSPEEYNQKALNEKLDVWSMGSSMYVLLTGVKPHNEIMNTWKTLKRKMKAGEGPFIDPRFEERSFAEKKLVEMIRLCWEYEPDKRIDLHGLIEALREAVKQNQLEVVKKAILDPE